MCLFAESHLLVTDVVQNDFRMFFYRYLVHFERAKVYLSAIETSSCFSAQRLYVVRFVDPMSQRQIESTTLFAYNIFVNLKHFTAICPCHKTTLILHEF